MWRWFESDGYSHYNDDDVLEALGDNPSPANVLVLPNLDQYVADLIKKKGGIGAQAIDRDKDLYKVHEYLKKMTGPLGRVLEAIEKYRHGEIDDLDVDWFGDTLQDVAILLGHTFQKVTWTRRLHALNALGKAADSKRILKDPKVKPILEKPGLEVLFSKDFDDAVQISDKTGRNLMKALGVSEKPQEKNAQNPRNPGGPPPPKRKFPPRSKGPFPDGPSQRGGGQSSSASYRSRHDFEERERYERRDGGNRRDYNRGNYLSSPGHHTCTSDMALHSIRRSSVSSRPFPSVKSGLSTGRESSKIPPKLEGANKGQRNPEDSSRVENSTAVGTISDENSSTCLYETDRGESHGSGSEKYVDKGSYPGSLSKSGSVSQQRLCDTERGGKISPHNKSEETERTHSLPPLQDGGSEGRQKPAPTGRLDVQNRSEGRIFLDSDKPKLPKTDPLLLERDPVRISLPGLRAGSSTAHLHKIDEDPGHDFEEIGNSFSNISG